jgi:DNA-binding IclR family transcriptional regulator
VPDKASNLAPAVARAVRLLSLLEAAGGVPQTLSDLARDLDAAKSSTSNICAVLEEASLIERRDTGYVLGRRTAQLGGAYLASMDEVRTFYRICASNPVLNHELMQLVVLDGTEVVYLGRHEGAAPLRVSAGVGDRMPASITAVGAAALAALTPDEVARRYAEVGDFPQFTTRSTASLAQLQDKLAATRARGYAIDDGEVFPNVLGLAMAVPTRTRNGQILAIGASLIGPGPAFMFPRERGEAIVQALADAVTEMSNPMSAQALAAWTPPAAAPGDRP